MIAALLACSGPVIEAPPPLPDVMIVVLDTVRADRLSAYGHSRPTSLQLEAIADAGVRFTDVTAPAPWTWPSHASLFTGLYPWEHGAHWADDPARMIEFSQGDEGWQLAPMRTDVPTLAERFGAAGYRTHALSANCLLHPDLGLMRGFSEASCAKNDAEIVASARAVLDADDDQPLLLFVNLLSAHGPYLVAPGVPFSAQHTAAFSPGGLDWAEPYLDPSGPGLNLQRYPDASGLNGEMAYASGALQIPPADLSAIADLYDGDLIRLDHALKVLVTAWNAGGHGGGILAVTSDHGELLGEHRRIGHGGDVFDDLLQVPLVIAAPGRLDAGATIETPVGLHRLGATLLSLAGVEPGGFAGASLLSGASGPVYAGVWGLPYWGERVDARFAIARRYARDGGYTALMSAGGVPVVRGEDGVVNDPAVIDRFTALLAPTFEETLPAMVAPAVSERTAELLEALGYVEH